MFSSLEKTKMTDKFGWKICQLPIIFNIASPRWQWLFLWYLSALCALNIQANNRASCQGGWKKLPCWLAFSYLRMILTITNPTVGILAAPSRSATITTTFRAMTTMMTMTTMITTLWRKKTNAPKKEEEEREWLQLPVGNLAFSKKIFFSSRLRPSVKLSGQKASARTKSLWREKRGGNERGNERRGQRKGEREIGGKREKEGLHWGRKKMRD